MLLLLVFLPLLGASLAFAIPSNRWRPWLLPVASVGHLLLVFRALAAPPAPALGNWLALDALGKLFLIFVSVLFLLSTTYTASYLTRAHERSNRIFCTCLLVSLSMLTLVILSHHLGLMWVAMEATTLAMAPNIYYYRTARSLEATWKYLLICSVGIALALLGSLFLAYATLHTGSESSLLLDDLLRQAPGLTRPWLHAAFVLILIGYGTKMGLAPMHTWLPDAHGEAPAPVSALLSGALLPCAFLAILRVLQVCNAAGESMFPRPMLIFIGLLSMAVAAVFMVRQRDLKRLLAYSSVEHMGILVLGMGIGGLAVYGAFLHVINNGLTKVALFLCAGNIQGAYGSRSTEDVRGVIGRLPLTGALFLAAFLAITGSPPFGPFLSEFIIVNAAFGSGQYFEGAMFLLLLGTVFIGMGSIILAVVQGTPPENTRSSDSRDSFGTTAPILACVGLVLVLGLFIPTPLDGLLHEAAAFMEGKQ
jgi:hydrogenase-4 component F